MRWAATIVNPTTDRQLHYLRLGTCSCTFSASSTEQAAEMHSEAPVIDCASRTTSVPWTVPLSPITLQGTPAASTTSESGETQLSHAVDNCPVTHHRSRPPVVPKQPFTHGQSKYPKTAGSFPGYHAGSSL
ncbi:uncharacterized protein BKA78DRAFT_102260 [Phyllosticta capitalensis]|uniref:uncharacterized protein n=1 Tax=Phyllosticta capitalensis TaxID=121624 RepID=UPI00312F78A4